jgi:hypothetical protein
MMDWIPIVLFTFKILVFGTGMFFAIKWHYDTGRKEKEKEKEKAGCRPRRAERRRA